MNIDENEKYASGHDLDTKLEEFFALDENKKYTPFKETLKESFLYGRGGDYDFYTSTSLASIYTKVSTQRKEIFRKIDRIKRYYIVDLVLSQIGDDALSPEVGTHKVIEIGSLDPIINKELKALQDRVDLNSLIKDVSSDLYAYGEYYLSTVIRPKNKDKEKPLKIAPGHSPFMYQEAVSKSDISEDLLEDMVINKKIRFKHSVSEFGLLNVLDNVDQGQIVTLTYHGEVSLYLMVNGLGQLEVREPADFIRFALPGHRIRIDLHKELEYLIQNKNMIKNTGLAEKIPRYLRVGKSLIWPIIDKLGELEILEALVPATKLNKITAGSIVGINVPTGMDIDKAITATKKIEQILNRKTGVDPATGELTVADIISAAGRVKAVPIFGDKGTLSPLNYNTDDPEELLSAIQDIRRTICESIGVPYELIFKSEEQSKGQILKKYARYLRKLKGIQLALEEGVRQMIYIHLANAEIDFNEKDVYVKFFTPLVDVDNLDQLEFTDASVGILSNLLDFIQRIGETEFLSGRINNRAIIDYINAHLGTVGLGDLLFTDEKLRKLGIDPKDIKPKVQAEAPPPPKAPTPPSPKPPAPASPAGAPAAGAGTADLSGAGGPPLVPGSPTAPKGI